MPMHFKKTGLGRTLLSATALAGVILLGGTQIASADHHGCEARIERAEIRLDRAIARDGVHSWAARQARANLDDVRRACWRDEHGWWDGHLHIWHTDHW
jgi:hypothetical protein